MSLIRSSLGVSPALWSCALGQSRRHVHRAEKVGARPVVDHLQRLSHDRHHDVEVVRVAVVVHADVGRLGRIGACEHYLAAAVGLYRVGQHDHVLGVGTERDVRVIEVLGRVDAQAVAPDVGVVAADEKPDLGVMGVHVAKAGRVPGARLIQRRRHETVAGRRPPSDAALGFGPDRLQLGRQRRVIGGIGRQRSRGCAQGVGSQRHADFRHRHADAGSREHERELQVVLEVFADVGCVVPAAMPSASSSPLGPIPESNSS